MIHQTRLALIAAIAAAGFSTIAHAAPLDPKHLPADTKWVIHVDMEAAKDSKTYDTVSTAVFSDPNARDGIDKLETITDSRFPEDLKDVTMYGAAANDEAGVIVVRAKLDRSRLETLVKQNPQYGSSAYRDYTIHNWEDNGKTSYGAFHDDGTIIISKTAANVQAALDAIDEKGDRLKPDDGMVAGLKPGQLVYVGARDLKELHQGKGGMNPLSLATGGWIALTEDKKNPVVTAEFATPDADSAKKLKQNIDGLKAFLGLAGGGADADPVASAAADAVSDYDSKANDTAVDITIPVSADRFATLIDAVMKKRKDR